VASSVVDRHRVDADPDPAFHFDGDPDPTSSYTQVGKTEFFLTFIHSSARVYIGFVFLIRVIGS
jgi:hypothetical protein